MFVPQWIVSCFWITSILTGGDVLASPAPSLSSRPLEVDTTDAAFQFHLPYKVEVEQISDDEWILTRTRDLKRHGVLGRIVDQVPPYVINIDYRDDASVHLGNQLVPLQTQQQPVRINFPTNGSHELFTLMAIDPDVPSRSYSTYSQFLQWLVVNIPQEDLSRGDYLAEYLGPLPSVKGGRHRIIFLAYRQEEPIDVGALPHAGRCDWVHRARFDARKFARLHRLGSPVAINHFITEYDTSVNDVIENCFSRYQNI